jgi:GT2 family glycosyltransferase
MAVVVTVNRPAILERCLTGLCSQTRPVDHILVVDNGSTDETVGFLAEARRREPRLDTLRLPENLGPAGGFETGLERAAESDSSHVWVMDDDVVLDEGCLESLLARQAKDGLEMVFPRVLDETETPNECPGWYAVLISRDLVQRAGLPLGELFWWTEDTEYLQWRLPRLHGARVGRAEDALARHTSETSVPKPAWKFYYEIRNTFYYRLRVQTSHRLRRASRLVIVLTKTALRILLLEDRKLKKLRYLARGLSDGLRGRLGKTVDPATG